MKQSNCPSGDEWIKKIWYIQIYVDIFGNIYMENIQWNINVVQQ